MTEPVTTISASAVTIGNIAPTVTVIAAGTMVAADSAIQALPWLSNYGIIFSGAFAAGMVQISTRVGPLVSSNDWVSNLYIVLGGLWMMLRILFVSLALTAGFAFLFNKMYPLPSWVWFTFVSFVLGLCDGNWQRIFDTLLNWAVSVLPARKTEDKP
jgi:hypothetical protein